MRHRVCVQNRVWPWRHRHVAWGCQTSARAASVRMEEELEDVRSAKAEELRSAKAELEDVRSAKAELERRLASQSQVGRNLSVPAQVEFDYHCLSAVCIKPTLRYY